MAGFSEQMSGLAVAGPEVAGDADSSAPGSAESPERAQTAEATAEGSDARPEVCGEAQQLLWFVLPCLVLVVMHVLVALSRDRPLIFADEAGYMGNARFLAGGLPIKMLNSGGYYPGYSLLLAPVYWLGLSPVHTYQAILGVNGLLLSTAYVSLVFWVRWVLGDGSKYAYAVAFVASMYPAFMVQPGFAMSESAVIAGTALLPLVGYRLIESRRLATAVLFSLLTVLLYAIHPRLTGTLASVALGLGLLSVLRVLRWRLTLASWVVLGAGVLGTRALTAYVTSINGGGTSRSAERMAATMTKAEGLWAILLEVMGQYWYLHVVSGGLVLVGLVATARLLLAPAESGPRKASPRWVTLAFTLLSTALAFGVACAFLSSPRRVDHYIYGRYNEGVLAPVLVTGLWALVHLGKSWRRHLILIAAVGAIAVSTALLLQWARGAAWSGDPNLANIVSLIPLMRLLHGLKLLPISLIAFGAYAVVAIAARWRPWLGLTLVGSTFLVAGFVSHKSFLSMQKGRAKRQVLYDRVATMKDVDKISYDAAYFDPVTLFFGQYFLPQTEFVFFNSSLGEEPTTDYVVSSQKWSKAKSLSTQLIGKDVPGFSLWSAKTCCQVVDVSAAKEATGFYAAEKWPIGTVRWTNGDAVLSIPIDEAGFAGSNLYVDIASMGRPDNRIRISANGKSLFNGKMSKGRARLVLPLANVPVGETLELTIASKTFVPSEGSDGGDTRELGVAIRSIQLVPECCLSGNTPFAAAQQN